MIQKVDFPIPIFFIFYYFSLPLLLLSFQKLYQVLQLFSSYLPLYPSMKNHCHVIDIAGHPETKSKINKFQTRLFKLYQNSIFKSRINYTSYIIQLMIRKSLILGLVALLTCTFMLYEHSDDTMDKFTKWKKDFNVQIKLEDEVYRRKIFEQNVDLINSHNSKQGETYKMGVNEFAHLTREEFIAIYLSREIDTQSAPEIEELKIQNDQWIDWRSYVSPVKSQGACSASYAFAAVGAIQGYNAITTHRQYEYSNQQVVDCSKPQGNAGCSGGSTYNSFEYIKSYGLTYRSNYPYHAYDGPCMNPQTIIRISNYSTFDNCDDLMKGFRSVPVAVMVDASNMQFYSYGVFTNCGTVLNYNMLLVTLINGEFSLKASWGTSWGQIGYIRIKAGNSCGVCMRGGYVGSGW